MRGRSSRPAARRGWTAWGQSPGLRRDALESRLWRAGDPRGVDPRRREDRSLLVGRPLGSEYRERRLDRPELSANRWRVASCRGAFHVIRAMRESKGIQHELAHVLGKCAGSLSRLGRYTEANADGQECLAVGIPIGDNPEYRYGYMVLAEILAREEPPDWEKADQYLEEAFRALRDAGAPAARLARLRRDEGARQLAERAREIFSETHARPFLREAEGFLGGAVTD